MPDDTDIDAEFEHYAELIKRPENDDDYTAFHVGHANGDEQRMAETEVSLRRCVTLKNRDNCPHGWTSCDLVFYCQGAEFRLNGLVAADLESLGKALTEYAHRLRNY